ncbi:hypothetical protein E2C01_066303 [Portunus trituberculatus]|uniref:Uncharacterized protein n=1 Tax=Portunus trituberculatus TaxID=210409 RepID=A0A5B7HGR0_PORTR|nr:hypothetical protein [Portunus trituberculatus]
MEGLVEKEEEGKEKEGGILEALEEKEKEEKKPQQKEMELRDGENGALGCIVQGTERKRKYHSGRKW